MNKNIILTIILLVFFSFLPFVNISIADEWGDETTQAVTLTNPIGETNPNVLIGKIIQAILGVVGSLALLMFIYGGFTWMLAAGNNERVQKGKEILIWATMGLVVIFSSYALIKLIFQGLGIGAG